VKCSESLSSRVYIIIRKYIDYMKLVAYMAVSFITSFIFFWLYLVSFCIWLYVLYASV
jgi:hypothetical protein